MVTGEDKMKLFEELMQEDHVLVHLDGSAEGVELPDHLQGNPALTLKLSYLFQGETSFDDDAIVTHLKFSGTYHRCVLPWSAIWGMTSAEGKQVTWPESLPRELVLQLAKQQLFSIGRKIFGRKDDSEKPNSSAEQGEAERRGKARPHLKRVK